MLASENPVGQSLTSSEIPNLSLWKALVCWAQASPFTSVRSCRPWLSPLAPARPWRFLPRLGAFSTAREFGSCQWWQCIELIRCFHFMRQPRAWNTRFKLVLRPEYLCLEDLWYISFLKAFNLSSCCHWLYGQTNAPACPGTAYY